MDLSGLTRDERQDALRIIQTCMVNRQFFVEHVLGVKDKWVHRDTLEAVYLARDEPLPPDIENWYLEEKGIEDWQLQIMQELDAGETRESIKSAIGVGKTALVSWLAIHFLLFRDDVKVIVTSPSFNQLKDGIIPEISKWIKRLPAWLKSQLNSTTERIERKPDGTNNFISFRTARKETPEALQGIHATHVMLLVDEASGVHEVVYEAGQGTMSTAGAISLLIGNPTRVTGLFYNTHRKLKGLWKAHTVTSFQSTRVSEDFPKVMERTYGKNSQQYKVRVLGEFPEGNADSVIPRLWVEEAAQRLIFPTGRETSVWGVDPGRGGDPSGFCNRAGRGIRELEEWYDENLMTIVGKIKTKWDGLDEKERPVSIYVDVIGLGAGVVDRLDELGLPVVGVNVAEMAAMQDRFVRLRAELWNSGREWFEAKACWISQGIPQEIVDKFIEECAETAFKEHSSGRMDVESKKDLKKRGVHSPNLTDAFLLTLSEDGAVANGVGGDASSWNKPLGYRFRSAA